MKMLQVALSGIQLTNVDARALRCVANCLCAAANASAVEISSYEHGVAILGMYVLNAASFAFFAIMTMNFVERGVAAASSMIF
jgi:hypothetical protein